MMVMKVCYMMLREGFKSGIIDNKRAFYGDEGRFKVND